jgi:hypothetical protein
MKCLLGVKFPYGYAGKISRYLDEAKQRFSGKKSHDYAVLMTPRLADFERACLVALQHIELVDPWIIGHKRIIANKYSDRGQPQTSGEIIREHNSYFRHWFKANLLDNPPQPNASTEEKPSCVVVRRGKRNIIGMDGVANEQDFDQYGDPKMEDDYADRAKYTTTLPNRGLPFKRRTPDVPGLNYSTAIKKGKKIVKR